MKALTLWQPWAQLVAIGAKQFETRPWGTGYRGLLAIHAAKATEHLGLVDKDPFASALCIPSNLGVDGTPILTLGAVIAIVRLVEVYPVESILGLGMISNDEFAFGDYSPGRLVWELEMVLKLEWPIPARGYQRLWNWKIPPGTYILLPTGSQDERRDRCPGDGHRSRAT